MVGADRVAKNGDTANKIGTKYFMNSFKISIHFLKGTYGLAVLAKFHNIPFYVALPASTLDENIPNGDHIVIEERPHKEVTHI